MRGQGSGVREIKRELELGFSLAPSWSHQIYSYSVCLSGTISKSPATKATLAAA